MANEVCQVSIPKMRQIAKDDKQCKLYLYLEKLNEYLSNVVEQVNEQLIFAT